MKHVRFFYIACYHFTPYSTPSLFGRISPEIFICLLVCSFGFFSFLCWLYTELPKRLTNIYLIHWPLCYQHLASVLSPSWRSDSWSVPHAPENLDMFPSLISDWFIVSFTTLAPLWSVECCLQIAFTGFLLCCRTVLCLSGNSLSIKILVSTHQEVLIWKLRNHGHLGLWSLFL